MAAGRQQIQNGGRPSGTISRGGGLTSRQEAVLRVVHRSLRERGYPPSMREIGEAAGLSSTSSVSHQIGALVAKNILRKDAKRPRAYSLTAHGEAVLYHTAWAHPHTSDPAPADGGESLAGPTVDTPLLGRIAAGAPITAEQHVESVLTLPRELVGSGEVFALTVGGDSMTGAHILDGDTVVVRAQSQAETGEVVAAMLDGEATVKRFKRDGAHVWLMAENPAYEPICGDTATILGKVVTVLRTL
ncbi:transcriptional repressor LexA [Streptomyces sp. cg28]|uniref:transcriptional repressor LexA n=1 Tax=Streptomyces sp. cg28 TaxID=3403457 RepID=UPI003B21C396